ncbi:LOW QUALITY PROTEIN: L-ascorbate oxidase [Nematostella vectensis]|uniref:LOW QUALITY PROTEIN: L-ascorbate oxidase n=1 Tax=Nematostella vectensis TaxID=45351 RepID=UPI002077591D|nr:LOW QUALITY PROTEIN: L-ascorbate oxidase [Nematostella vectensis]
MATNWQMIRKAVGSIIMFIMFHVSNTEICTKSICEYEFVVRETKTMMYSSDANNAYQVKLEDDGSLSLLATPHGFHRTVPNISIPLDKVHTVDGINRTIITINDQFPGPTIEVTEGAEVVVTVVNHLLKEGVTIHWHGVHMRSNPWMDGVAYISQCPIQVKQSFQYRFIADPPGTHWYHSHFELQKSDGLYGALIIHRSLPRLPYHVITLSDWFPWHSTEIEISNPLRITRKGYGDIFYANEKLSYMFDWTIENHLHYWSGLVNGKGRHGNNTAPLSIFRVKPGSTYQLHVINTGLVYPYRFAIDQHQLTVVESDGHRVKPVTVDSAIILNGESYVFEFKAKTKPTHTRYWMRGVNFRTGVGPGAPPDGWVWDARAVLQYESEDSREDPMTEEKLCSEEFPCVVLNCPWRIYSKVWFPHHTCIPVSDLRLDKTYYDPEVIDNQPERNDDVHEVFLNFGFPIGSSVNARRFISPRAPLFQDPDTWGLTDCAKACSDEGCWCTHVVELPPGKTIHLVLNSYNNAKSAVHVHGHSFQVLKIGYPMQNETTGQILGINPDITCDNDFCSRQRWSAGQPKDLNFDNPPLKDTVVVPSFGYTVVRLSKENPGYWFVHCHVGNHMTEGMALILNESFAKQPPAPPAFPTCQQFSLGQSAFQDMLKSNEKCLDGGCTAHAPLVTKTRNDEYCEVLVGHVTAILVVLILLVVLMLVVTVVCICLLVKQRKGSDSAVIFSSSKGVHL